MEHTDKRFEQELSDLRARLIQMGDVVAKKIESALRYLAQHDLGGAQTIIQDDVAVNRMDIELEETCLRLLVALHQPEASDLRLITAVMKITTELERIGDRVVNICEAVADIEGGDPIPTEAGVLKIGELTTGLVRDAMQAFSRNDNSLAKLVLEKDIEVDRLYDRALPSLLAVLEKAPDKIARDAKLALLSKDLNEISEHATNIAEVVMFLVGRKEIMHMDVHERRSRTA